MGEWDMADALWSGEVPTLVLQIWKSASVENSGAFLFIPHLITQKSWSRTICCLLDFASDWSKQPEQ
ncbi:hypothetical protein TNCV_1839451 [Trichonephila clavipes]|nr:hypothetical protein TNCV_1839451 [Trichonephila clavipes]